MAKMSKLSSRTKCADVNKGGYVPKGDKKVRAMFHETKGGEKRVYLPKNKGGRKI